MRPMLNKDVRTERPAETEVEAAEALLQEFTADARRLESRYAKDTEVPEGGE